MSRPLANYLRSYRKRARLSQDEMAFLLGGESGVTVSRYERARRAPDLERILAYEVIFGAPAPELFAGVYQKVGQVTYKRVEALAARLASKPQTARTRSKLELLGQLVSRPAPYPAQDYAVCSSAEAPDPRH